MKLKNILLTAVMALFTVSAYAASADELKVYINPGHGSWGPNNRHMATIGHSPISTANPDTTDFFESNTNLIKCNELFHRLVDYGMKNDNRYGLDLTQNVVMSRIANGPYPYDENDSSTDSGNDYNRTLSEIASEAETWGADMFISVHSNANVDGLPIVNYLYFCLDGYASASGTKIATSKAMSLCGWNHRILDRHTMWTSYDYTMTSADVAAGKGKIAQQNLGVLNHDIPGYLVEGYFHTYQPARHRAMNYDVDRIEGLTYARGVADYYGLTKESTGDIYGVVRDLHEKFSHDLYTPNTATFDKYKPLNGVNVTLWQGSTEVAKYTTDVNYNGAFVFKDLTPGDYTLTFSFDGYKEGAVWATDDSDEATSIAVTVKAAEVAYPTAFLESLTWTPPTKVYVNYPDSTAGKGYTLLPKYETKATAYDLLATQLEGKTVRRQLLRDDKLYVLALDAANEPYIYLADLAASTVTELDKAAVVLSDNGRLKLSDIALTADHVLVASGTSKNHYSNTQATEDGEARGKTNFYKWTQNEETGLPETCQLWFSDNYSGNYYRAITGKTITYTGTIANGTLVTTSINLGNTMGQVRMGLYQITEGVNSSPARWNWSNDDLLIPMLSTNEDYELMVSPLGNNNYVFDGNAAAPFEFTGSGSTPTKLGTNSLVNVKANGTNYFKYADKSFMVTPLINEDGKAAGVQMFDITDGFSNAKEIAIAASIDPVDYTYASAHGELALTLSADDRTTGANIELFLAVDGKVTKFTVGDFYTSANLAKNSITGTANPYAYALKGEVTEGEKLSVSYSLNADAADVNIYVIDENNEVVASYEAGAQATGDYTAEIDLMGLEEGNYTWEIEVAGETKTTIERYVSHRFYHPSGLDIDNNPENASFGTLFVCEGYNQGKTSNSTGTYVSAQPNGAFGGGLYIFNPRGEQIFNKDGGARFYPSWLTNQDRNLGSTTAQTCGADFNEVSVAEDGRIFVNRYNFNGDYYLVAENLEQLVTTGEFTSLLAGKTMTDGIYYEGSEFFAGPAQSFDVYGSGEDLKLLALSRDSKATDAVFSQNRVVEYDLGTGTALEAPTVFTALDQKYTISYDRKANIQYDNRGGVWYIQYRGTPSDSQPALIYVDANGEIKYFEGDGGKARYQGAISVSPDGNRLVASSASGVASIYEIIRDENGNITLNEEYRLTHNMGGSLYSAAWDAAGNFFLGNASNEVVQGYALPRTEPAVTKAASKYSFVKTSDGLVGVEGIEVDTNAPVKYYNLQGIEVDGDNLSNGIYIKVQGNKSTKIYVK